MLLLFIKRYWFNQNSSWERCLYS